MTTYRFDHEELQFLGLTLADFAPYEGKEVPGGVEVTTANDGDDLAFREWLPVSPCSVTHT